MISLVRNIEREPCPTELKKEACNKTKRTSAHNNFETIRINNNAHNQPNKYHTMVVMYPESPINVLIIPTPKSSLDKTLQIPTNLTRLHVLASSDVGLETSLDSTVG